ncbi:hypothetical protein FNV43_RR04405 [Rhamnella rubrinervis]|uniref:Uncharacterized protein n=1 Tax=Rhamnella rubrinervis TaxID=2594499 RepID=A0A8K0HKY9_9ROSA|nr:hypothetical protein FNV43_RR04405 [Rhamnella rubrinervis]
MSWLSRELVFVILQFLDKEKFNKTFWPVLGWINHQYVPLQFFILLINFVTTPTNDLVVFGGGHAATITLRATKQGLLKAKAKAAVAPTWLVLFLLSLVKNLAWKQGMQNIHAFVVMIVVWNFPDQVAYADLVAAGSLAAAREKGLVSMVA